MNNYYPFGLMHNYTATTQNAYQNKYNGKELQETGMYDYGARFYMPDVGRWGVVDPLAESSRRFTPYHYGNNNPVRFIDPDGRQSWDNLNSYNSGSAVASFMNRNGFGDENLPMFYSDEGGMMIVNQSLGNDGQGGGGTQEDRKMYKILSKKFRSLIKEKDYTGAINFVMETYKLDEGLEEMYIGFMISNPTSKFSGMVTHNYEDISTFIEITQGAFKQSLASFTRALDHEFVHVLLFGTSTDILFSKNVREVLAYHRQIFGKKLPSAPHDEMKLYYNSAKTYLDKLTPSEIKFLQPIYNTYIYSKFEE